MNKSKYTSETTVDLQFNETMEKLYSKYGEEMMRIEGQSEEETARWFLPLDMLAMPVVDDSERLVGMLTFDDAVDIVEEMPANVVQRILSLMHLLKVCIHYSFH